MAWDRGIYHLASTAGYWASQSVFSDATVAEFTGSPGVSRCDLRYTRTTPTGTVEDVAQFGLHLAVHVAAGQYAFLTPSQKADAESSLNSWWAGVKTFTHTSHKLQEFVWHDIAVGDAHYGPADRITVVGVSGTASTARLPDQVAVSVTFKTASRKHWGRVYLPGIAAGNFDTSFGRLTTSSADSLCNSFNLLQENLLDNTAATEFVVFSKEHGAVLSIDEMQVDDIPDVIRSRRFRRATYRAIQTGP